MLRCSWNLREVRLMDDVKPPLSYLQTSDDEYTKVMPEFLGMKNTTARTVKNEIRNWIPEVVETSC